MVILVEMVIIVEMVVIVEIIMVEMVIMVLMFIMVEMVIMVELVIIVGMDNMVVLVVMTFKLDFPGNLCRSAFAILAMFFFIFAFLLYV